MTKPGEVQDRSEYVSFRLGADLRARANVLAERQDRSLSSLIRHAAKLYIMAQEEREKEE